MVWCAIPYLLGNRINFAKHGDLMTCLHAQDLNVVNAIVDENDMINVKDGMRACMVFQSLTLTQGLFRHN